MTDTPEPPAFERIRAAFADGWSPSIVIERGWHPLLVRLHAALVAASPEVQYNQIKSKRGGLVVYLGSPTPETDELTRRAELESLSICERCGNGGQMHQSPHGWLRTLCPDCAELVSYTPVEAP